MGTFPCGCASNKGAIQAEAKATKCRVILAPYHIHKLRSLRLVASPEDFDAAHGATAGHADADEFLVARGSEVGELQVGPHPSALPTGEDIPDCVRRTAEAFHGAKACAGHPLVVEGGLPGGQAGMARVVEDVLGLECAEDRLRTIERGVGKLDPVGAWKGECGGGFNSAEDEALEICGPPQIGGTGAYEVDAITFAPFKGGKAGAPPGARIPIEPGLIAPGFFGPEGRIADIGWVPVVEIGVGGQAEGRGGTCAQLQVTGCPPSDSGAGGELVLEVPVDFIAEANREGEALEGSHVEGGIDSATGAAVDAEIVTRDVVAEDFGAVVELGGMAEVFAATQLALVGFDDMAVGEVLRAVAIEDEEVGAATVGEGGFGLAADGLANAGEPVFGALPGVEVSVELLCSEGAVVVGEVDGGAAPVGGGCEGEIAEVAIGEEAGGEVAGGGEVLGERATDIGDGSALLLGSPIAESGAEADFGFLGWGRDEVDDAGGGIGAVEGGTGPLEDLDAGEGIDGDGYIHVEVGGLGAVDAESVPEDECLAEGSAADGDAALDGAGCAFAEVDGGVEVEEVGEGGCGCSEFAGGDDADGAFGLFEGVFVVGAGYASDGGGGGWRCGWRGLREEDRDFEQRGGQGVHVRGWP
jgi:hypothetical protein